MTDFATTPIFTQAQGLWFAALLALGVVMQFAFSPRRRAVLGGLRFAAASALVAAPAVAGVTLVRGAWRLGYLNEGRGFIEANLRSLVVMSGAVLAGQLAVRYLPPLSWLSGDLRRAGRDVWNARLNRWMGRQQ
ncbi:MAG: hypothetical protein KF910_00020 [Brevundimonas sp.]|uniref:hypothetical protein n=1 Tax=Brevundimonas sp. TaxID=1871086 RepID=UPI0025C14FA9|nr:hypothetical protein [Brevundimonas sp.]MBX3475975.1 hypothetical protein [Brevundimonas sp.]